MLDLIGPLYVVERACPAIEADLGDTDRVEALAIRATARREQAAPMVGAIHSSSVALMNAS